MNVQTKEIKKIIKHKKEMLFLEMLNVSLKEGYEKVNEPILMSDGTWGCLVKKTIKWDNPNPSSKRIKWSDMG